MAHDLAYANGWEAAKAAGFCIQCMTRRRLPDGSMCEECRDKRNVRSKVRTERRPTTRRTRKKFMGLLEEVTP